MTDELLPYDSKELSPAYLDDMIRAIKDLSFPKINYRKPDESR